MPLSLEPDPLAELKPSYQESREDWERRVLYDPLTDGTISLLYTCSSRRVLSLGGPLGPVLKLSLTSNANELSTSAFIAKNTTVPASQVIKGWFDEDKKRFCPLFERVAGVNARVFFETIHPAPEIKDRIVRESMEHLAQLRRLTSKVMGPVHGDPLFEPYLAGDKSYVRFKPEDTESDFLDQLIVENGHRLDSPVARAVRAAHRSYLDTLDDQNPPFVFSHCDVCPQNVMVSPEDGGRVSAVVDWDRSGFFPAWWEGMIYLHHPDMPKAWKREALKAVGWRREWEVMTALLWEGIRRYFRKGETGRMLERVCEE